MSGFLSRKYLQYRGMLDAGSGPRSIDEDLPCLGCGYNLRGLNYGRNCPECGQMITRPPEGSTADPLLAGDQSQRSLISMALLIGAACLVMVIIARLLLLTGLVIGIGIVSAMHYVAIGFVLGALWCASCVIMVRAVPMRGPKWNVMAKVAAWSQILWIPGYVLFAMRINATAAGAANETALHIANLLVRGLAGAGALGVAFFMMRTAEDAELEDAASRINLSIWVLPIVTIWVALLPVQVHWLLAIFFLALPLAWMWFVFQWARSFWEMHRHILWNARLAAEHAGRFQRIDERKRELQEHAESMIRPLERGRPIVFRDDDRFCKHCQYNLRGLKKSNVCPECGKSFAGVE